MARITFWSVIHPFKVVPVRITRPFQIYFHKMYLVCAQKRVAQKDRCVGGNGIVLELFFASALPTISDKGRVTTLSIVVNECPGYRNSPSRSRPKFQLFTVFHWKDYG